MTFRREDLVGIKFSGVATGEQHGPVTPGDILPHDFLARLGVSPETLAREMNMAADHITAILGLRGIVYSLVR